MSEKISIGLRGWRFDEDEVFTETGEVRPFDEMSDDTRRRLVRLTAIFSGPCDACWLIHGDENIEECNEAAAVYGEPLNEAVLCDEHEPDFLYWFREEGGAEYAETDEFEEAFHEWFLDGGRAPEGYAGLEHVDTDPRDLPTPDLPDPEEFADEQEQDEEKRIDLRNMEFDRDYPTGGDT
ncbi:hypothetical protein [Haloarchaeobius iranensis]|uniref:Uncharacterized protein n=1 Tax=Haloarchaeobius iranensis TaxID=996166 RepID=A0A1G9W1Y8_9EURY|nr:hypothetical protein [Haloarchaeobius iranensis]SDM78520.1 hypothetical protein SAMN05192554_107114 [Haloarchaeobius iranensis]